MEIKWNKTPGQLMAERGINNGGKVQKYIDSEVVKQDKKYIFFETGHLSDAHGTVFGSGEVVYDDPGARYLYNGLIMVDPVTGSPWARKNAKKIMTSRKIRSKGIRGPFWFERMKADHKKQILSGAKKLSGAEK